MDYVFNVPNLTGTIGDAYGIMSTAEVVSYINAIAVMINPTQLKIVIQGDYTINTTEFNLVNQRTGEVQQIELTGVLSLQPASYLGTYDANENAGKQITVLNDIEFNDVNITFASVDYSGDGVYNWVKIGNFINGSDGRSIFALTQNTAQPVFQIARINDLVVAGEDINYNGTILNTGDLKLIASISPLVLENKGNIRGATGLTGATGATGADGEDGLTPEIINGYWYIGEVNTGVKAEGIDGTNGTDGQSFAIQSGLFSVPANVGTPGNTDPQGNALNILPAIPTTGITGKGYIVYDPLTTPLNPYYDLYWANDGDSSWTIIHPFNGSNGRDGTNGYTPYIQNNNWYINNQNTGVPATGPVGPKGPKGINFMGSWVSENEYYIDDTVTYNGSSYICIQNHSGATATPDNDNVNWILFVSKGDTGATGATGTTGATGAVPNISVNVVELAAGSQPTATRSGTNENPIITFGIPRSDGANIKPNVFVANYMKDLLTASLELWGGHELETGYADYSKIEVGDYIIGYGVYGDDYSETHTKTYILIFKVESFNADKTLCNAQVVGRSAEGLSDYTYKEISIDNLSSSSTKTILSEDDNYYKAGFRQKLSATLDLSELTLSNKTSIINIEVQILTPWSYIYGTNIPYTCSDKLHFRPLNSGITEGFYDVGTMGIGFGSGYNVKYFAFVSKSSDTRIDLYLDSLDIEGNTPFNLYSLKVCQLTFN